MFCGLRNYRNMDAESCVWSVTMAQKSKTKMLSNANDNLFSIVKRLSDRRSGKRGVNNTK